ncbi:hypothetical protein MNB_SM-7-1189 [hydrothermal vent metagenome]|uniref:Uncharacterized protein n=1 Tax=hydrothermal vent metagenome TaxID=652676 RepID=A0A1W1BER1_9ZZZZ
MFLIRLTPREAVISRRWAIFSMKFAVESASHKKSDEF